MDEAALLARLKALLASADPDVVSAYVYGSRARGTARADSDLDLALLLRASPPPTLHGVARDVEAEVERELRVPVQALVVNGAPADLVHRVLRDGTVVLDRDRAARLRFEVQSRNEYFDLEPVRRLYRRMPA